MGFIGASNESWGQRRTDLLRHNIGVPLRQLREAMTNSNPELQFCSRGGKEMTEWVL